MASRIDRSKVDKMFKAYVENASAYHVHKVTGVSIQTVQKYIDHGDPGRNIEAFRTRYDRVTSRADALADEKLARSYSSWAQAVLPKVKKLEDLIDSAVGVLGEPDHFKQRPPRLVDLAKTVQACGEIRQKLWEDGQASKEATDMSLGELLSLIQDKFADLEDDRREAVITALSGDEMPANLLALLQE